MYQWDGRKQLEYLTVSLVNTFMIAAIQGGVWPPHANAEADQALRRLARISDVSQIPTLVDEAAVEMCRLVRQAKKTPATAMWKRPDSIFPPI